MVVLLHLAAKLVLTGLLCLVASVCIYEVYRLWLDRTLVIAAFDYVKEGQPANESGQHFARLVNVDLAKISQLYPTGRHGATTPLTSTGPPGDVGMLRLPEVKSSILESVEVKAYGLDVGSVLKSFQRWIERPREIRGSVTERDKRVSVYAEVKGGDGSPYWQITDSPSQGDATWAVACRVFRMLARDRGHGFPDAALFNDVTDDDFCLFNDMVDKYQRHLARTAEARPADAKAALDEAGRLINVLLERNPRFPWVYKAAGFILRDLGRVDDAERAILRHLKWAEDNKRTDQAATELLAAIRGKRLARARLRPLQPGGSVSLESGGRTVGIICCMVRDQAGTTYLLSADDVFEGAPNARVVQPSVADGGSTNDAVAEYVRSAESGALARVLDAVQVKYDAVGVGAFTGVGGEVKAGDVVATVGRSANKVEGAVRRPDVGVWVGEGAQRKRLEHAIITTTKIASPGDVGAPVVTTDGRLIGLVYAISESSTVIIPIERTLNALKVELVP